MPSAAEIAKLFGFIAKETPKSEHVFNAALGAGAKGVYNVATGRDLTDGMVGAGIMGAGAGVGLKTYRGRGMAGAFSKIEEGLSKASSELSAARTTGKAAAKGTPARAQAAADIRAARGRVRGFNGPLNDVRSNVGLRQRG